MQQTQALRKRSPGLSLRDLRLGTMNAADGCRRQGLQFVERSW